MVVRSRRRSKLLSPLNIEEAQVFTLLFSAEEDSVDVRVLDAATELIGRDGERNTTMDGIAAASKVSRATIFRRFGSKQAIIDRVLLRELRVFVADLMEAASTTGSPPAALAELLVRAVRFSHTNPVVRRLITAEPERLVYFARSQEPSFMALARILVAAILDGFRDSPGDSVDRAHLADVVCHLAISYALVPNSSMDLQDDAQMREVFTRVIAPSFDGA